MDKEKVKTLDNHSLMDALHTSAEGLGTAEAQSRLLHYGPNFLKNEAKKNLFALLLKQFRSSLVYLLLVAAHLLH